MNSTIPADKRTRCEVWTRVMGYHRPVSQFNPGKQSEHRERRHFTEAGAARGSAVKHLALISLLYLLAAVLSSCTTVAPDAFDQAEAAIFNESFQTNVVARPKRQLMFMP